MTKTLLYRFSKLHFAVILAVVLGLIGVMWVHSARAIGEESAVAEHVITVHDEGDQKGFYTTAKTLREALKQANIRIDPSDRTEPELDTVLDASSYEVNIYRARPVTIRDGMSELTILSAYRTPKQIAEHAGMTLQDEDSIKITPARNVVADGGAAIMTVDRALGFTFTFYGKTSTAYTQGATVGEMLAQKGIKMGAADTVEPSVSTPMTAGMTVKLWRNGKQTITQEEDVAFETEQIKDADKDKAFKQVETQGVVGRRTVTYEIDMQNGIEVSRREINSNVTKQPVKQVERIGTKVNLPAGSHEDWMAAAGIAPSDYGYVNYIVMREGGWEPCKVQGGAINCNYVAEGGRMGYGMVQATPGGKMASAGADWATNPITQLRWATGYAVGRYGSWSAAYNYWIANRHW